MTQTRSYVGVLRRVAGRAKTASGLATLVFSMGLVTLYHVGQFSRLNPAAALDSRRGQGSQMGMGHPHNSSSPPGVGQSVASRDDATPIQLPDRKHIRHKLYNDHAHTLNPAWTEAMTEARRKVMEERREEVRKKCGSLKLQGVLAPNWERVYDNFIWSVKHHLVWCPIFKAASTSWVKHFLLLQGEMELDMGLHKRARQLYKPPNDPQKKKKLLEVSRKMMIVRHPLERLLSAYRDKMLREGGSSGRFRSLQRKIAHSYLDPNTRLDPPRDNHTDDTDEKKHGHPTFTQFLMRVRDDLNKAWKTGVTHRVNMHWRPYWITCAPCHINYDLIARVETLDEDQEFIIRELGLQDVLVNVHAHASSFDVYNKTSEATKIYYGQVPLSLLKDVARLYKYDFEIYGYSPEPYYKLVRQDQG